MYYLIFAVIAQISNTIAELVIRIGIATKDEKTEWYKSFCHSSFFLVHFFNDIIFLFFKYFSI